MQEFVYLAGQQPRHGHTGPAAYHLRNVFFIHLFLEEPPLPLLLHQLPFFGPQSALQVGEPPIAEFCSTIEIVLALSLIDLDTGLLDR